MNADERLRALFAAQAAEAPDADLVRARVRVAVGRRRRARTVARTGVAAVAVGTIAVGVPLALGHRTGASKQPPANIVAASQPAATPSSPPVSSTAPASSAARSSANYGDPNTQADADRTIFYARGYTYDDAVLIGGLWRDQDTFGVKAIAGQVLLDGRTLPIEPNHRPGATTPEDRVTLALTAFSTAGYSPADGKRIAAVWGSSDVREAEVLFGQQLLDGRRPQLP